MGTDSAFEMVKAYFEAVGLNTDFNSVYEEAKLLTDYYEKREAEEFIREQTEQIIEQIDKLGIWSILPGLSCSIRESRKEVRV